MKQRTVVNILVFCCIAISFDTFGRTRNSLENCWNKQVRYTTTNLLEFSYKESISELEHSFEPWQQTNYSGVGKIWVTQNRFSKIDTIKKENRQYFSLTNLTDSILVLKNYGDKKLSNVTVGMFQKYKVKIARYNPGLLIDFFHSKDISQNQEKDPNYDVYESSIDILRVKLYISKTEGLLHRVIVIDHDDLLGDITTEILYQDYFQMKKYHYPTKIVITKVNGKIKEEVKILNCRRIQVFPTVIDTPSNYQLNYVSVKPESTEVKAFSNHIHFIELQQCDARVVLVEFRDFFFLIDAPLKPEIGEQIINAAKKIAPSKPIKYFSFSHYHPYALGGVRPFVYNGATIICYKDDIEYLNYIVNAQHALVPDSLQIKPRSLQTNEITDSVSISDGDYQVKVYHIGKDSFHTKDYLIYYFPSERLVFENDLVWISKDGLKGRSIDRQVGFFNAISKLGLNVSTIVQSWPMNKGGVKSIIAYSELEQTVNTK